MEIESIICENCSKSIPSDKHQLHEAYCLRNMKKCNVCNEVFNKSEIADHQNMHVKKQCSHCLLNFELIKLQDHEQICDKKKKECVYCLQMVDKNHQCKKIPKVCIYCNVSVPTDEHLNHQYMCGNKTEKCKLCQKHIALKNFDTHQVTCAKEQKNKFSFENNIINDAQIKKEKVVIDQKKEQNIIKPKADQKKIFKPLPSQEPKQNIKQVIKKPENIKHSNEIDFDIHEFMKKENEQLLKLQSQQRPNEFQNQYHQFQDNFQGHDDDFELQRALQMSSQQYNQFPTSQIDDDEELQRALMNSMQDKLRNTLNDQDFQEAIKRSMMDK